MREKAKTNMNSQKLFRSGTIEELKRKVHTGEIVQMYLKEESPFIEIDTLVNPDIQVPDNIELIVPDDQGLHDFDNAQILYEAYKQMNSVQATDIRIWTYLSHVTFWKYMKKRRPIDSDFETDKSSYILNHWFIDKLNPASLFRQDISLLWWVAHVTYDELRKDPYELTKEAFSMLDYTRHLLPGTQGRNRNLLHAILEFVIENKELFSNYKESKVRFLMRKINFVGGYQILPSLNKDDIKNMLTTCKTDILAVTQK